MLKDYPRAPFHAVALSEEVHRKAPLGVSLGDRQLVLWRDNSGIAHALEDRCPHRRAPLSLGCVRHDGNLRCGYHGWSFDGTGQVIEIPQMREQKRFPPLYRAEAFAVAEHGGFVFVDVTRAGAAPPSLSAAPAFAHHGIACSPIDHARVVEILLDGPQLLIGIPGIRITEYPLADPELRDGRIVYERGCRRRGGIMPDRLRAELPYSLRLEIDCDTGLTALSLRDAGARPLLDAILSPVPARRNTTAIRWRAKGIRRGVPLMITGTPDGRQVETLLRDASTILDEAGRSAPLAIFA